MKVRVTFEVSEEQRLAVGLASHGKFKMMSHEEMSHYIATAMAHQFKQVTDIYDAHAKQVVAEIKAKLELDT